MDVEFDSQRLINECADRGYGAAGLANELRVREVTVLSWFDPNPTRRRVPDAVNTLKILVLLGIEAKDLLKPKEVVVRSA